MGEDRHLRDFITKRIELALRGRSWSWLADQIGVRQSSLSTQKNDSRYSIETLVEVSRVLRKPIPYFLPGQTGRPRDTVAEEAFYRVVEIVEWAKRTTPDDLERGRDLEGVVSSLPAPSADPEEPDEVPPS